MVRLSYQAGDFILPESEICHGVHGGYGQHQDLEDHRQPFVEIGLKRKESLSKGWVTNMGFVD